MASRKRRVYCFFAFQAHFDRPLAVFNDHAGVVCSLNFFRIPAGKDRPGEFQAGLASASDDGTVKIYFQDDFGK